MKNFKKKCILVATNILLVQYLSLLPIAVLADDGTIKIAGQSIFSITSAADAGSLAKRAETVQNNLDNALVASQDHTPASVNITYVKGTPVITLGGYQVVTVGTQDASSAHTTPALLANQWADAIRGALVNQASINSYVAQLSGNYALSAPPVKPAPAAGGATGPAVANAATSGPSIDYANPNLPPGGQTNLAPGNYSPQSGPGYESYNNTNPNYGNSSNYGGPPPGGYRQGHVVYAPAGQIIPITLKMSIDTEAAKAGDIIQGSLSQNINLGESTIPAGTIATGQVESAKKGGRFTKSGELQITFTQLQLPDGSQIPISGHIVGGIGKYKAGKQPGEVEGENWKNKVGSVAFRGLLGAGGGAALGTAVGAIAGGGYGAGMGAWSGAAIGGGLGAADSLILRKGQNVIVPSGTNVQLQLDQPINISMGGPPEGYAGGFTPGGPGVSGNYSVGGYPNAPGGNYGGSNYNNPGGSGGSYNAQPSSGYAGNSYNPGSGGSYNSGAYNNSPGGGYNAGPGTGYQQYNPPPLR
jgi:hypothetical protein